MDNVSQNSAVRSPFSWKSSLNNNGEWPRLLPVFATGERKRPFLGTPAASPADLLDSPGPLPRIHLVLPRIHPAPPAQNWLWPSKCAYTQLRPPSQFYAEKSLEPFAERTSRLTQKEPQALHGKGFDPYTGRASTLIQEEPPHQPRPQLHPQPAPRQGPETSRLNLDDQRKRPVVDQFDIHHRAEHPFFYGQTVGFAQFGGEGGY